MKREGETTANLSARWTPHDMTRRRLLRVLAGSAAGLVVGSLLSACGGTSDAPATSASGSTGATPAAGSKTTADTAAGNARPGGTLRYGLSTYPPNLDPLVTTGYAADTVKQQVYSALVRPNEKLEIMPELALSWEQPDDKTAVFKLRPNVKWHDGSPFTADDVKFTLDRILAPDSKATRQSDLVTIDKVEVVDPATIRIGLKQPDAALLAILASPQCMIVSKKFVEGGGNLNNAMIGTGPFKVADVQPGVQIKLVKNPDFWEGGRPYLDGITFTPYPDDTARVNALKTAGVDIIDYVPYKDQGPLQSNNQFQIGSDKDMTFMWLHVRLDKKPLDDPRVRQAIAIGIDRDAVVKTVFFGRGVPMTGGVLPPEFFGGDPALDGRYKRNLDKAKQLLTEAGYPNGFEVNLLSTSTYSFHKGTGEVVQSSLAQMGIKANLELVEWATDVQRRNEGQFDLLVDGGGYDYVDAASLAADFQSKSIFSKAEKFSDPEVDDLFAKGRATVQQDARKQIYEQIDSALLDKLPWIYLLRREQAEAMATKVKGYIHIPGGNLSGLNLRQTWLAQ